VLLSGAGRRALGRDDERTRAVPERGEQSFRQRDGLADNWVSFIADDRRGSLWISSAHGGLTRYRDGKFTTYTTRNGLFTNEVYCVLADDQGDLWLGTSRGIGRVRRAEIDDYESGKIAAVRPQVFTMADGMKMDALSDECQPNALKARDGRLWFATRGGAVMIDPAAIKRNEIVPACPDRAGCR
jgi:ligand-binding sensor domain-containing protein